MSVRSKSLLFSACFAYMLVFGIAINLLSQDISVAWIGVNDTVYAISCTGFGTFNFKGNWDGALSPGERVNLDIGLVNNSIYPINSLTGILYSPNPSVQTTNPNCYDGIIGVRYSPPIAPGDFGGNLDPFVVEISQNVICLERVDFQLLLTYTTSAGPCSTGCTETYDFSLPLFSLIQNFDVSGEHEMFPNSSDQNLLGVATNSKDIGIFWNKGGINFAITDLDGNILYGPKSLTSLGLFSPSGAFYNESNNNLYEIAYRGGSSLQIMNKDLAFDSPISLTLPPGVTTVSDPVSSAFNDEGIDEGFGPDHEFAVLYPDATTKQMYLSRYRATNHASPMFNSFYTLPAFGDVNNVGGTTSQVKYLESDSGIGQPGCYFVAYETHDGTGNRINIYRFRADNLSLLGSYVVTTGNYPAKPSLAIDPHKRRIAIAWVSPSTVPLYEDEIWVQYFDEFLNPIYFAVKLTNSPVSRYAGAPVLTFWWNYFLSYIEYNDLSGVPKSSWIKMGEYAIDPEMAGGGTFPIEIQNSYASDEWLNQKDLMGFMGMDEGYFYWDDTRSAFPNRTSLHGFTTRPLHAAIPYNVNPNDDYIISQAYESSLHPSMASKGGEFIIAWRNANPPSGGNIYYRTFNASGTAIDPLPVIITSDSLQPSNANPIALNHGGNYEVFWRGPFDIFKWNGGGPVNIAPLTNPSAEILDAAVDSSFLDLILYKDNNPSNGDENLCLYAALYPHWSSSLERKIENIPWNFTLEDAKIVSCPAGPYPWAVAWIEKDFDSTSKLYFAYLNPDLTFAPAYPVLLQSWLLYKPGKMSMAMNSNRLVLFLSYTDDGYAYVLADYKYDLPVSPGSYTTDLFRVLEGSPSNSPFYFPNIKWTGSEFIVSWAERGSSTTDQTEYPFYTERLDEFGNRTLWPIRIASPMIRMFYPDTFNFDVCVTDRGGGAVYTRDSGSMESNIYFTPLSWASGLQYCQMYNQPPTVSTTGPFTVEYGNTVALSGSSIDDDYGDWITTLGWDITNDGVIDITSANINLTFQQQLDNGLVAPGTYPISLIAIDSHGEIGSSNTTLTISDTTPPSVTTQYPNGGETLRVGDTVTIMWDGWDNYMVSKWDVYFCTDWNGTTGTWQAIALGLAENIHSVTWVVPNQLSATCRIKIVGTDGATPSNVSSDLSDGNFYIVQVTTSAIRTLILTNNSRIETYYPGESGALWSKLTELANHTKVAGILLDLNNVPGLPALYSTWDSSPTNQANANAVANAIRNYTTNLVGATYTNAKYLVLAGDDRIIPFYRVTDGTATYPETQYTSQVDCNSTVGSAICQNYYLTDNVFGDMDYDTTTVGVNFLALPDLATGRLVESPSQIAQTVNTFIAQDGQITLNKVFITGYDFLTDSATTIRDNYISAGKTTDSRIGTGWDSTALENDIYTSPMHVLHNLNDHSDHFSFGTPSGILTTTQMNTHSGTPLNGYLFYNVGCHSGLNVPPSFAQPLDLPELMMKQGVEAYIGNTGFGWGLRYGSGYSEKLMEFITSRLLSQASSALGTVLGDAKRDYYIQDHRYDVFDEKILFESTLYGLPMYQVVVSSSLVTPPKELEGPDGPDYQEVNGIALKKSMIKGGGTNLLPSGVTELTLNFSFGPATYQLITTPDGNYYTLNGRANAEIGDALQPLFTYDSRLSGTISHGVLFTGGSFTNETPFNPVVGAPASNNTPLGEGPIAPQSGSFMPGIGVTHPQTASSLTISDLTRMTVYSGYFKDNVETRFNQMNFVIYYSNSADKTSPAITDPGPDPNALHTLNGLTANFSVAVSDASGIYRVVVAYTDHQSAWQSFDLTYNPTSGKWEGSLNLKRNISYHVQAVDNAGNVGYLKVTGADLDSNGQPTGSTYNSARLFNVTLTDTDGDGMPDVWETQNGLNPGVNDASGDPDQDGYLNSEEYWGDTNPQNADSDGDGDNDGSEAHHSRNPLNSSDGKRLTIFVTKVGNDIIIDWPSASGDNGIIDGPYWIYRSADPFFDNTEILVTTPSYPIPTGTQTYTDVGGGSGPNYYYTVVNARYNNPAPVVDAVAPNQGPLAGGTNISVYGSNFSAGATVKIGVNNATNVVFVNSTKITCTTTNGGTTGAKDVKVTNLNGQFGTLTGGFTYY